MSGNKEEPKSKFKLFRDHKEKIRDDLKRLKVIYTDLDGTMFNDQGCVIKDEEGKYYFEAVRLLEDIKKRKWDLVMVSGRDKYQLRYHAQIMGIESYVAELGAEVVYRGGQEVHITFDHDRHKYDLTHGSRDLDRIIEIMAESFPGKIEGRTEWSRNRAFNALFFGEIDLVLANELLKEAGYAGLQLVDNGLSALVDLDLDVEKLHIYNLMPRGVNKANGVKFDREFRGFDIEECIALGDSPEDLKMAGEVKYFFLMKNALGHRDEIERELGRYKNVYITSNVMNRGWHEVISFLLD